MKKLYGQYNFPKMIFWSYHIWLDLFSNFYDVLFHNVVDLSIFWLSISHCLSSNLYTSTCLNILLLSVYPVCLSLYVRSVCPSHTHTNTHTHTNSLWVCLNLTISLSVWINSLSHSLSLYFPSPVFLSLFSLCVVFLSNGNLLQPI